MVLGNDLHVVIGFDEPRYYISLLTTVLFFMALLRWIPRLKATTQDTLLKTFGGVFLGILVLNNIIFMIADGYKWDVHYSLPLQLCSVSFLLIGLNSFLRKQRIWEITLFLGIVGGIHSLLTPQLAEGDHPYFYFVYYFKHGTILFFPIIHHRVWGFGLDKKSWLRVLVFANIYLVFSLLLNFTLNHWLPAEELANYFYTWEPPAANNPIIQGDWPWYLIPCEIALIVHLMVIQWVFRWRAQHQFTINN